MKTVRKDGPALVVKSVNHAYDAADDTRELEEFKPLTAEEVQNLRRRQPLLSVWRVVLAQVMVGWAVAALTWLLTGKVSAAWSAASEDNFFASSTSALS